MAASSPTTTPTSKSSASERGQQVAPLNLAYLAITSPQSGSYQGGILIVNEVGLPVEFRYSDVVQPTVLQQVLYGKTLGNYIKRHVLLGSLLSDLAQPYALILTQEDCFLDVVLPTPVIRLMGTQTSPAIMANSKAVGDAKPLNPADWLVVLASDSTPVRVGFPAHPTTGEALTEVQPVVETLVQAAATLDVLEPFERVKAALQALQSGAL
jgi:hypothetical protein